MKYLENLNGFELFNEFLILFARVLVVIMTYW